MGDEMRDELFKHQESTFRDKREIAQRSHDEIFAELLAKLYASTNTSPDTHTPFYESESLGGGYLTRFTITLYPNEVAARVAARLRQPPPA